MAQLSFSDLVQEMKGNKTTNDYDVLVAYNEAKVNEMLKNQAQARGPLTLGPFKIPVYDERQDEYYDKNVVMNVAPPVLRFSGLDQVILNLEVTSGTTQIGKGAQKPLARGLSVELKAQLCNAPGRVDQDGNFQTTKENDGGFKDSKPVDYKVTLNPKQKDAAQGVCIDMTSVTASVNPKDGNDTLAKKEADALAVTTSQIRKYFQESKSFTYYLAGVSNKYASEAGSHLLRPESFKFSIVASGTAEAALCMWIEVSGGSHNGKESSRSSPATFHPRDRDCNPVPSGSTACVIMHHDLLWDKFLKPGFDNILKELTSESPNDGNVFKASGKLNAEDYDKEKVDHRTDGKGFYYTNHRDAIHFSVQSPKSSLTISRGIANTSADAGLISYRSDEQTVGWDWTQQLNYDKPTFGGGTVYLTYSWKAHGHWTNTTKGDHPNTISLTWTGDTNWSIEGKAKELNGWEEWCRLTNGGSGSVKPPHDLVAQNIPAPTVDLHMDPLDYFLTTNLLCPGKHLFKADAIGASTNKGLALPHDFILTGEISTA